MAVKFSEFSQKPNITEVTEIVGYYASSDLNVRIVPSALDTNYAYSTTDGASPALTLVGTKAGVSTTTEQVTLSGLGGTILAGTGTNAITFRSTTYILAAGANADPAVNTPITLTGDLGGDPHTDTVNLIGTGTVQITSAGGVITIDGGSTGDVTSFSSTFGNYITGTTQTNAVGDVSIGTVNLSAIDGTSDANTKFLSKDNTWDVPTYTTYDLETTTVANGQTNVPVTLASAAGDDTLNLLGAGTVTIGSDSGTGLITITGGGVGDVTSINTATSGVSSTANPITLTGTAGAGPFTGAITVASNAYAGGADVGHVPSGGSAGEYLDGASGAWITIPAGYTSWNLTGDSGTTEAIADGNTVDVAGGTDITTVASSADTLTVNHDAITRTDTTSTDAPTAGTSVDLVKTISTSAQGHVTAIDVSTVTWPAGGGGFGSINQTTGTGSSLGAITLGSTPAAAFNCLISISGVTQNYLDAAGTPNWTVSTNTLTFAFNPPVTATNGIQIIVIA
jgi:hypothetical protein